MSKLNPKNKEEAFAYQFEYDVKMLRAVAYIDEKQFEQTLAILEAHIQAYRSTLLKK